MYRHKNGGMNEMENVVRKWEWDHEWIFMGISGILKRDPKQKSRNGKS